MMDDSQMDSSDATADVSLGHEIMKAVHKNQSPSRQNVSFILYSNMCMMFVIVSICSYYYLAYYNFIIVKLDTH